MPTLREKIETDGVERLVLPPNRHPKDELVRYKRFLKVENHRLFLLHRAGAGGRQVGDGRAAVIDVLIRHILRAAQQCLAGERPVPKFALVAIGGYGRGELNPHSDIDIMFLHEADQVTGGKAKPDLAVLTDALLYTLWDVGLKVGHSVRSPDDCVQAANADMQSKTSLIEARLVDGDSQLFERFRSMLVSKCVRGFEKTYIPARLEDQAARRSKFGNSATMQEPNIKNGCGGLRDYQNLLWMAYFKYRVRTLGELRDRELISETEMKQLDAAYDFLLWVRNDLHYHAKRAMDVLGKSLQPAIAHNLGYTDRSPSKRLEAFMKDLYSHMRNIFLITRTIEQRLALMPAPKRLEGLRQIFRRGKGAEQTFDGFKIVEGQIHAPSARIFRDQSRRLMRVFLYSQQRGVALHPDLVQMIRNLLPLVGGSFLKDPHVHETFLEILNQRGNVAPVLRAMHDCGFLGKYMPEFGRLTCLVQHEFYHQYTADEHTLVCIEKLDAIWDAKQEPYSRYTQMFQSLERPSLLYLALLLHDAGKAYHTGKHADIGANLALKVAKRLHLDGATTHSLRLVIENHLMMAQISQRRDLEDPTVIESFARLMQTRENLVLLTLHTFADSQGTSDQLWNGFKDSLLWALYHKTLAVLTGSRDYIQAEAKQIDLIKEEVASLLPPTFSPEEIEAHFASLPGRYFLVHTAREILADLLLAHRFMHLQIAEEDKALEPVVTWHNEPDRGYTSVHICTWDRSGLFEKITGSLTAAGLNILSAQIFTRADGIILDNFFVADAATGGLAKREEKERFEEILQSSLLGGADLRRLIREKKIGGRVYKSIGGERIPTVIDFDNSASAQWTVIDVETEDRMGLLYVISEALTHLGLNIALAKIVTEKGAAIDTFYVANLDGRKIESPEQINLVEADLKEAINKLD